MLLTKLEFYGIIGVNKDMAVFLLVLPKSGNITNDIQQNILFFKTNNSIMQPSPTIYGNYFSIS